MNWDLVAGFVLGILTGSLWFRWRLDRLEGRLVRLLRDSGVDPADEDPEDAR